MLMFLSLSWLLLSLLRLLKQTTNHISDHTQQAPSSRSSPSALTWCLPAPIQIVGPVERSVELAWLRRPLPLKTVDIVLIRVRRIPRIMVLERVVI
jgi:hypothetical protein